jgi:sterol desaturase/sphingolipid hydroxylase (fatty acid hydroxylase superfamily)
MIGFPVAVMLANAGEWLIHKYVLHGVGRSKKSMWSFHWHEHHKQSRKNGFVDHDYFRSPIGWNAQGKEVYGLIGLSAAALPLLPVAPFFTAGVWYSAINYYRAHKRSHLDPTWAREHLPWHYDHHMGPNQHANWCVTKPWFDHVMGTREYYCGTERERQDQQRAERHREKREAAKQQPAPSTAPAAA